MAEYGQIIYSVPRHSAVDARLVVYNDCILRGNLGIVGNTDIQLSRQVLWDTISYFPLPLLQPCFPMNEREMQLTYEKAVEMK